MLTSTKVLLVLFKDVNIVVFNFCISNFSFKDILLEIFVISFIKIWSNFCFASLPTNLSLNTRIHSYAQTLIKSSWVLHSYLNNPINQLDISLGVNI